MIETPGLFPKPLSIKNTPNIILMTSPESVLSLGFTGNIIADFPAFPLSSLPSVFEAGADCLLKIIFTL